MVPKVSVVIPVYNVEQYLIQCLDSVLAQTLMEIEIICIDDGSTDRCPDILDEYAEKDCRVKVVHKANGGYGSAMNVGMDVARGEYIGIVDSDDYLMPQMYEVLYAEAKKDDLDLIKSDFYLCWDGLQKKSHGYSVNEFYNRVLDGRDRSKFYQFIMNTWTGIYRRKFIQENNIKHNETPGASFQDNGFWFQTMSMCKNAKWIDQAFYMHRKDNPSASTKDKGKMLAIVNEYDFIEGILLSKSLTYQYKMSNYYRMRGHRFTFYRIDDSLKKEYAYIIMSEYKMYRENIIWEISSGAEKLKAWLDELSESPDEFCDKIINNKNLLAGLLQEEQYIIIYGTGKRAYDACIKLRDLGYFGKILFAAVTKLGEEKKFMGLDVKQAECILPYKEDALVLVSVVKNSRAYEEIVKYLIDAGVRKYSDTEMIQYL